MQNLLIILADYDDHYVDKLTEFINRSYSPRVKVKSFTEAEELAGYCAPGLKADILLIHPDFLAGLPFLNDAAPLVVILTEGRLYESGQEVPSIYKYQSADKIIARLTEIYLEKFPGEAPSAIWQNKSRVLAVYSPTGGAGKSSLVLGLAAELGELGYSVLCLSLESVNSIAFTLTGQGSCALTHVLLSLHENPGLVPFKVERYKRNHGEFNFQFLEPADNFLEISELKRDQIQSLLENLRAVNKYDVILIDADSEANEKSMLLLDYSDAVFLVMTPDLVGRQKIRSFLSQACRVSSLRQNEFLSKMIPVINKYNGESDFAAQDNLLRDFNLNSSFRIPYVPGLWVQDQEQCRFDINHDFRKALSGLIRTIEKGSTYLGELLHER